VRIEDVVSDTTVLQFGQRLRDGAESPAASAEVRATRCSACGSHFSPDGRFCPFDGTPLVSAEDWNPSADALLGTIVDGRYEVQSVLGEGGMGTVYAVKHRALGKRFALKALRKELATDGEIAARFIQEARTAAAVSHPGLVEITDFGKLSSGQVYFVMELLDGQSLAALIRKGGPMPAARGLEITRQIASAVRAAHTAGIVHRDLKPENIHIGSSEDGRDRVKIVDFGLAKVIGSSKLTRAGMVFGTPHYMSPEQAAGESVDHRADIYAVGIVIFEMFTGRVPFEADSYMGVLTKHMYMEPPRLTQIDAGLSALGALEQIVLRCLKKRPSERYEDLSAFLEDLERAAASPQGELRAPERARSELPRLADELELPSRSERRARRGSERARWTILPIAFALGAGAVLLLRSLLSSDAPAAAVGLGNSAAPAPEPALPVSARVLPVVPAVEQTLPVASAAPPESASPPLKPPTRAQGAKGSQPRPTAEPRAKAPSAKPPALGGEIVDPWAR
jgi:serine/threonine-protein kinase